MFDKIKRLGTDTAIYGVSTVVGRFLTFILTRFYTNVLAPAELGIVATMFAYIAFLNILYGYGMEAAFMRYVSTREIGTKEQNFSVPFFSIAASSVAFTILIWLTRIPLAELCNVPLPLASIVTYGGMILCLDALAIIPFASLRMERKAKLFSALKLWNIIVTVVCNLIFLLEFRWGVEGIFVSNIIASASTLLLLIPTIIKNLDFKWNSTLHKALLQFSLPTIPAYLATMMIQVIDRPILETLTDQATVGVYQANYRLGIFMMLVVSMFDFAWRPFFLSNAKDPNAKQLFARVLTYFFLLMVAFFLVVSLFIDSAVTLPLYHGRSILDSRYWSGLYIVPVVLLAYMFLGISNNLVAGIYIEKQTQKLPIITFVGAGINVAANFLLIPSFGMMGAAVATLLSYSIMAVMLYFMVRNIYPVEYEWERMAKIAAAAIAVYALFVFVEFDSFAFIWKCSLLLLFCVLMYLLRFFDKAEVSTITSILIKRRPVVTAGTTFPPTE
jgi:O-antigen/teichoic acid export membrane protein